MKVTDTNMIAVMTEATVEIVATVGIAGMNAVDVKTSEKRI
jgi:hypothetical protein